MAGTRLAIASLLVLVVTTEAYRFSRLSGLFDNFHEYDIIDTDVALNDGGVDFTLSQAITAFAYTATNIKIYDTGYISLDATLLRQNAAVVTPSPLQTNFPYIAPNWIQDNSGYGYHMAYREANSNTPYLQHDLDRCTAEVNRALDQYPETWICQNALIVTWDIFVQANTVLRDKFQVVLAGGADADYVLFLYETLDLSNDDAPFTLVNGMYATAAEAKGAGVCSRDGNFKFLISYSNYKCGNGGIFLLDLADGEECSAAELTPCGMGSTNLNCLFPTVEPADSCTESFHCLLTPDKNFIKFDLDLRYYQHSQLSAIDYVNFIGSGTDTNPGEDGVLDYIDDTLCGANTDSLPFAGTASATATRSFETPLVDGPGQCGVIVNTADQTLKFAFANYDPMEPSVIKDGNMVVYGTCHYTDLPVDLTVTKYFNDASPPTQIPVKQRYVIGYWLNENFEEITAAEIGDLIYAQLCFDPSSPFELYTEPFGIHVISAYLANNEDFIDATSPDTNRMVQIIENGCVALDDTKAFHFATTYKGLVSNVKGELWCIRTGIMVAAKFSVVGGSNKLFLKINYGFCTQSTETLCDDSCGTGGGRGGRSVKVATDASHSESLIVELDITDKHAEGEKSASTEDCVATTTLIATIVVLLASIVVACVVAMVMLIKLKNRRYGREKH